jgi:hypothetical protein
MSAYTPTGSDLNSTTKASALVEVVRKLNDAEALRNAANPGVAAKNNISMTASFDTRTISITATMPFTRTFGLQGQSIITYNDYLGGSYSAFTVGTGDAKSPLLQGALVQIAQIVSGAELAVTPDTDRPNNVQITDDYETSTTTITINMPFTPSFGANGEITITALDYV